MLAQSFRGIVRRPENLQAHDAKTLLCCLFFSSLKSQKYGEQTNKVRLKHLKVLRRNWLQ